MSYTLASVAQEIAALLNDASQTKFTNAVLLPYAKTACREMQLELELNGSLALEKKSAVIIIPVNTLDMTGLIPADMLEPQRLEERLSGSSDLFTEMTRRQWTPNILPSDSLRYWDYREQMIFFVGATTIRDVKIYYLKAAISITTDTTPVTINNTETYFIHRTAALAAQFVGENETRAAALNANAGPALSKVVSIGTKNKQGARTRRRPYTLTGRRRWI